MASTTRSLLPANNNTIIPIRKDFSFIGAVRETFPAHYSLFNAEIYFSNMLLSDLMSNSSSSNHPSNSILLSTQSSLTYRVVAYVANLFTVTLKDRVSPFITKQMANLVWLIRYKILFDNLKLNTIHHHVDTSLNITTISNIGENNQNNMK
ncbi:hypothetical protein C9374_007400 [Naegleria lovaniensis]|uniref:Uncharacterized protein n=1 Tax=Naegleria lovaniensis TaxID=51637 RepID=A0AA88GLC5_NAELO|nr:uncharacterized protein C9374_007400 [Naegleria lovaniensis]KAG2379261.1 hypothetical protein C9374_007400 [Naegleria lovaniensis]